MITKEGSLATDMSPRQFPFQGANLSDADKEAKMTARYRSSADKPWKEPSGRDNTRIHEQK